MNQVAQTSSLPAYRWHNLLSHFSVVFDFCSHNNSKNWEDLPDSNYDVNRKPIWWQGFWKMMQNSGFQTLKMSWNVLNCPFRSWINHFLPQILQPGFSLEPGRVTQSHLDLSQIRYFLQTRLCLGFFQGGRSARWEACPPRRAQLLQGLGSLQVWPVCNVY